MSKLWILGILMVPVLAGCVTVQRIGQNQQLLKEFQAPAGEALAPTLVLVTEPDSVSLGGLKAVKSARSETPDFWTGALNELFTKADLKRVVVTYEIEGGEGVSYRLNVVHDLYRPKSGGGSSWMLRKPEVVGGPQNQKLALEYSHMPGGEVLAKLNLGTPITVKLYYNGIPPSGGWVDVFNTPTALFADGAEGRTYLQLVGTTRLLEPEGHSPSTLQVQTALLLGYLLLQTEGLTIAQVEQSVGNAWGNH